MSFPKLATERESVANSPSTEATFLNNQQEISCICPCRGFLIMIKIMIGLLNLATTSTTKSMFTNKCVLQSQVTCQRQGGSIYQSLLPVEVGAISMPTTQLVQSTKAIKNMSSIAPTHFEQK